MEPGVSTGSAEGSGSFEFLGPFWSVFTERGVKEKHAVSGREKADIHLYKYLILAADTQEIHIQIFPLNLVTVWNPLNIWNI